MNACRNRDLLPSSKSRSHVIARVSKFPPTNSVVKIIDGIKHKRLGSSDIVVSELGLGTQRWCSADFNAPDQASCFELMDRAILNSGINLIDTAEQYPIPSDRSKPEGLTETVVGRWMSQEPGRRQKVVVSTKITGGSNITPESIVRDCEGSLKRLNTDYIDVYMTHWPARYSPQTNWGQSLQYHHEVEKSPYYQGNASIEEMVEAFGSLVKQGKIRGYGFCNDNCYGLTASCYTAKKLGVPPPVSMQNDFSIINRRIEENGVSEASSPSNENVGFMSYNALAGGVLTGKYLNSSPLRLSARGRFDDRSWGDTLYRYRSGPAEEATKAYAQLAKSFGLTLTELALRWARDRAAVTTVLVGHSNLSQLEESIRFFQVSETLPEDLLWEVDRVHMKNRLPIFSSTRVGKNWFGKGEIGELIP